MLDQRLITALHVRALRRAQLRPEHLPHVLFQASTVGALLEGAYDGDVSFAELAEHGDLGLGTLNSLDGEMIALEGRFFRANVDGHTAEIDPAVRSPFAVMSWFQPTVEFALEGPSDEAAFLGAIDERVPPGAESWSFRVDGEFERIHARSVPRQQPPYRPLTEVVADQHTFDLDSVEGTIVGFRFPDYAEGIEVSGYHNHFISADRKRGGHVLAFRTADVRVRIDPSSDLHVELPPGVDLSDAELTESTRAALQRAESSG